MLHVSEGVNAESGATNILATVSVAYIHSRFLTESYIVLCVQSSHFSWIGHKTLSERSLLNAINLRDKAAGVKVVNC